MLKTPILFLIFNRPDVTERVFEEIRKAQPEKLFIAADGHRPEKQGEKELCEQTRKIIEKVDWDCEVKTLFRDKNIGCKKAVASAIDWFFDNVEEGIILEDDCLPSQSFFRFCEEMLEYYRHDERIMHITGNNLIDIDSKDTYYFAKIEFCWGWATWKRAWKHFDVEMKDFPEFVKTKQIKNIFEKTNHQNYWLDIWEKVQEGKISSWAYIWTYTILKENGLCINPVKNMISNIGYGEASTHTQLTCSPLANQPVYEIEGKIIHPQFKLIDKKITEKILKEVFCITKIICQFNKEKESLEGFLKRKKLQDRIDKLAEKYKNKRVMIYGAGSAFDVIIQNFDISKFNIIGIADAKFNETGEYKSYKAYNSHVFLNEKPDVVLISLLQSDLAEYFFEQNLVPEFGKFKYESLIKM